MTAHDRPIEERIASVEVRDQDVGLMLQALNEFTNQLRHYHERRDNLTMWSATSAALAGVFAALSTSLLARLPNPTLPTSMTSLTIVVAAAVGVLFVVVGGSIYRTRAAARRQARILSQLVRRASQLTERGNIAFGERMVLEITVANAEAEIERVNKGALS